MDSDPQPSLGRLLKDRGENGDLSPRTGSRVAAQVYAHDSAPICAVQSSSQLEDGLCRPEGVAAINGQYQPSVHLRVRSLKLCNGSQNDGDVRLCRQVGCRPRSGSQLQVYDAIGQEVRQDAVDSILNRFLVCEQVVYVAAEERKEAAKFLISFAILTRYAIGGKVLQITASAAISYAMLYQTHVPFTEPFLDEAFYNGGQVTRW
jgi:hypothetical protein